MEKTSGRQRPLSVIVPSRPVKRTRTVVGSRSPETTVMKLPSSANGIVVGVPEPT